MRPRLITTELNSKRLMQLALDPNVFVIVNLRRRGHSEDEISVVKGIMESVDKGAQERIAELIALEKEDVISALVRVLPAIRESLVKGDGKSPAEIIEEVASSFENAL